MNIQDFCGEDGFLAEGWETGIDNILTEETLWLNGTIYLLNSII